MTAVTIGVIGTISTSLRKYPSERPVKHELKELYKAAKLDTAHLLRECWFRSTYYV